MTTYSATESRTANWPVFAALGAGVSMVLTAVGAFTDLTNNESGPHDSVVDYLLVVGITLAAAAVVFGTVVRTAMPDNAAARSLALSIAGFLSLVAFWSGLPAVLAAGAVSCALTAHPRGALAKVSVGISAITLALAVAAAIAG
jgi:hypothetical protein